MQITEMWDRWKSNMIWNLETFTKQEIVGDNISVLMKMLYYDWFAVCCMESDSKTVMLVKGTCVILQTKVNQRLVQLHEMSQVQESLSTLFTLLDQWPIREDSRNWLPSPILIKNDCVKISERSVGRWIFLLHLCCTFCLVIKPRLLAFRLITLMLKCLF